MIIRIMMFPVILLLVLYFAIALVVPTYNAIAAEKILIGQKEQELAKAELQQQKVSSFIDEVKAHDTEKEFVLNFLPNDQQEEILINDIAQLAETTETSLFSVGFSDGGDSTTTKQTAQLIEGRMIVTGTYESLKSFMEQLFHIDRLYTFKTIDIAKAEETKGDDEEEDQGPQFLSATMSFAYGYIPGEAAVSPTIFNQEIDYDLIDTVMASVAQTNPLVAEPQNRENPFLP